MTIIKLLLRLIRYTILIVLAFVVGAVAVLTLTQKGRENLASLISDFASSPGQTIRISGINGIWSGYLTLDHLVVGDAEGPWLVARGVELDWSPLALLSSRLKAERVFARRIEMARLPKSETNQGSTGSPALPIDLSLSRIELPEIALGPSLAGGVAEIAANGSLYADSSPMQIETDLKVTRTDGQAGNVDASIHFAPADNQLDLDLRASEPQGGILANLLKLPGAPPVEIKVAGGGPAADWKGVGSFAVDGVVIARIDGRHRLTEAGSVIEAKGDGEFERFIPERYRPLLSGRTVFDAAGTLLSNGGIDIERASIESNQLRGNARGIVDPAGASDFSFEVAASGEGVPLSFGTEDSPIDMVLRSASVRALGDGTAPNLDISAVLAKVATKQATLNDLSVDLHSDNFNIRSRTGPVTGKATAGALVIDNPTIAPLVAGRITADLAGVLSEDTLTVTGGTLTSDALKGTFGGDVSLADGSITLKLGADVASSALPASVRRFLDERVEIAGTILRDTEGHVSANPFSVSSGGLSASGTVVAQGEQIDAEIQGKIADLGVLAAQAKGAVDFALTAKGAFSAPDVSVTVTSDRIDAANREITGLRLTASGKADMGSPAADVTVVATVAGQALDGRAVLSTADGKSEIKGLALSLGSNSISGDLVLDENFLPLGAIQFTLPDVGPLAALALETAAGSVSGTARFSVSDDKPEVTVDARSASLSRGDLSAKDVVIAAVISDYLAAPAISGKINAATITSGTTVVSGVDVTLTRDGAWTGFDGGATIADIPAKAAGRVQLAGGETIVELTTAEAAVRGVKAALDLPTVVRIANGSVVLDELTLDVGGGVVAVSGTAGAELALDATLTDVPASLANAFVPNLDAAGNVSGTLKITGPASRPSVDFALQLADGQIAQTRAAGLAPLAIAASGNFAGEKLTFDARASGEPGLVLEADGNVVLSGADGPVLDLEARLVSVPAALADSFVPALDASGMLSGTAKITGPASAPSVDYNLRLSGGEVAQTRAAGLGPLDITSSGKFADQKLTFTAKASGASGLNVDGNGSVTLSGSTVSALDLTVALADVPASLANGFVPNLDASGTVSGSAKITGPLSAPAIDYALQVADGQVAQTKSAGLGPFDITTSGKLANEKLTFTTKSAGASGLALDGGGTVELSGTSVKALDLDLRLAQVPASLVNIVRPDLEAEGIVSGTAKITGPLSDPSFDYALQIAGGHVAQTKAAGLGPIALTSTGKLANGKLTFSAKATEGSGIGLDSSGTVMLSGQTITALDVDARLAGVPVSLANIFVPGLGASGTLSGTAKVSGPLSDPAVDYALQLAGGQVAQTKAAGLGPIALTSTGKLADGKLTFSAKATEGSGIGLDSSGSVALSGQTITALDVDARLAGVPVALANIFVPGLGASGTLSGTAKVSGPLSDPAVDYALQLAGGQVAQTKAAGLGPIALTTTGKLADGKLTFSAKATEGSGIGLDGSGTVTLAGTTITALDVDARLAGVPAALANIFVPGLGASGTLSGTAKVSGPVSDPAVDYSLQLAGGQVAQTKAAGLGPIALTSTGKLAGGKLTFSAKASGGSGLDVQGGGKVTLSGTTVKAVDVDVRLAGVPAALANGFSPGLGAAGTVSGTAKVSGSLAAPYVDYALRLSGGQFAQTRAAGLGAVDVTSSGKLAGGKLTFTARATEGSGLNLDGGGSVNITGSRALSLDFKGRAPFGFLSSRLAAQGFSLSGASDFNLQIGGTVAAPVIGGYVRTSGARFVDARSGIAVGDLNADVTLDGGVATLRSVTGTLSSGGAVSASGTVGINPGGGFPADLAIRIRDGRYTDGRVVTSTMSGDLAVTGPLLSAPTVSGTIDLARTVITIPERLPGSLAALDVKHRNASAAVMAQAAALRPASKATGGSTGVLLDLTVNADNQIFVQGRGVDAELGGSVRLTGPATAPEAVGEFTLRRGRLSIIGRRLEFTKGTISFSGSLIPYVDFAADSTATGVTVTVNVNGQANNPTFSFTSVPSLPQDEVMARLIFGRSMSNLSPLQIAQLAEAAAQFAGVGGSTSLLESLRSRIGLDDLDVKTTEDGGTAVSAGRYLNDRTYLSIEKGDKPGSGRAAIDLNVGRGVKLRGEASEGGSAKGGIFFEKEY